MKQSWVKSKLGDVCSFLNRGVSPKYLEENGICVLNQKCIRDHAISYELSRRHDFSAKPVNPDRLIQIGDVLVNSTGTGTLGRVAQVREAPLESTTVDSHVTIVRPKENMFFPDFFGYMLIFIEDLIKDAGEGCGGQTELARTVLAEKFQVHYPISIPEQKRIVAILDEAFSGIARVKEIAEKNLANARFLQSTFVERNFFPSQYGWKKCKLGDVCCDFQYGTSSKSQPIGKIPVLRMGNLQNGKLDWNDLVFTSCTEEINKYKLNKKDVLFNRTNSEELVGKTAIYDGEQPAIFAGYLIRICYNRESIDGDFLNIWLNSKKIREYGFSVMTSSVNQANISGSKLKEYPIDLPPIEEQKLLAKEYLVLEKHILQLQSVFRNKLALLDVLKKSLLHQAFSGELTKGFAS